MISNNTKKLEVDQGTSRPLRRWDIHVQSKNGCRKGVSPCHRGVSAHVGYGTWRRKGMEDSQSYRRGW